MPTPTTQSGTGSENAVQGLGQRGESDFSSLIGGEKNATTPGQRQTGGTMPRKEVTEIPEGTEGNPVDTGAKEGQQGQQGQQQQQTAQPSQADLIKQSVEAAVSGVTAAQQREQAQRQQQSQREEPLTPEAFDRKFGVVKVTPAHMAAIMDQDPVKGAAALNGIIQGAVTQALLMAKELGASEISKVKSEFTPHISSWQKHQAELRETRAEESFYKDHADLADEKELVNEIKDAFITKVNAGQITFATQAEANKAVAEQARKIVARMNKPNSNGTQGNTGQQQGNPASQQGASSGRQMSAASSAGRSGTGKATAKSDVDVVFGADAR